MRTRSKVRETLESIRAIDPAQVELLALRTRDREVEVFRDRQSGVIFIDDFYVGDQAYADGEGRESELFASIDAQRFASRQLADFGHLIEGRTVLEFGCGPGLFLRSATQLAAAVAAVEIDRSARDRLLADGIPCTATLAEQGIFDLCFMFHVLEHLPDPLATLTELRDHLDPASGCLVVEVPHARDFLLDRLECPEFLEFSLWSQHLVLHTRESLRRLLLKAGFATVDVVPAQRYGLANHMQWLSKGTPGGHRGHLRSLITPRLEAEYAATLAANDASDTLVAIARLA